MTWKDELLMFWIFCSVLITLAVRHFLGGAVYLVERLAASSFAYMPGLFHLVSGHLPNRLQFQSTLNSVSNFSFRCVLAAIIFGRLKGEMSWDF